MFPRSLGCCKVGVWYSEMDSSPLQAWYSCAYDIYGKDNYFFMEIIVLSEHQMLSHGNHSSQQTPNAESWKSDQMLSYGNQSSQGTPNAESEDKGNSRRRDWEIQCSCLLHNAFSLKKFTEVCFATDMANHHHGISWGWNIYKVIHIIFMEHRFFNDKKGQQNHLMSVI